MSDDASMPADSKMAAWGEMFYRIGARNWKPMDTFRTMKDRIALAGFINIQEHTYKIPIGTWPKHQTYKEAGRLALEQFETGLEVYMIPNSPLTILCTDSLRDTRYFCSLSLVSRSRGRWSR